MVTGGSYDLLGWQDNAQTDELDDVVARRDLPRLETLLHAEKLGSCALDVTDLDAEGYDADEREELVDGAGDDVVRFVAEAAYLMTVRTSAGRTAADFEFQVRVWGALGWVAKGLMENEEDGTCLFSPTSEEGKDEELSMDPDAATDLLTTLGREFCQTLEEVCPDLCRQDAYEVFSTALGGAPTAELLASLSDPQLERIRSACESVLECRGVTVDHIREIVARTSWHWQKDSNP